jgi:AraC-like DNA-binding protein
MEVVVNLADPFARYGMDGSFIERQPCELLVGPSTGPAVIVPTGRIDLIGVRLHPWGAAAFLGLPPTALRDELLPMGIVSRELARMIAPVWDARDPDDRMLRLVAALETIARDRKRPDPGLKAAIEMLDVAEEMPPLREIAARLGRSMRWIQRSFERDVGLGPKMLARIVRVQRALRLADRSPGSSWSAIAARSGYFDQSHLVRDFRHLVGCTPTELGTRAGELTDVFLERNLETRQRATGDGRSG